MIYRAFLVLDYFKIMRFSHLIFLHPLPSLLPSSPRSTPGRFDFEMRNLHSRQVKTTLGARNKCASTCTDHPHSAQPRETERDQTKKLLGIPLKTFLLNIEIYFLVSRIETQLVDFPACVGKLSERFVISICVANQTY